MHTCLYCDETDAHDPSTTDDHDPRFCGFECEQAYEARREFITVHTISPAYGIHTGSYEATPRFLRALWESMPFVESQGGQILIDVDPYEA